MTRHFRLYPVEQRWWSFADYGAVLDVVEVVRPRNVLEFGPGSSTLALIEGGAQHIDACEDHPYWAMAYKDRLQKRFPGVVEIIPYTWTDPLSIPAIEGRRYDLALIDGPRETPNRPAVLRYALAHCSRVLIPTEDADGVQYLRPFIAAEAAKAGRSVELMETGPLAGGFALIQ